MEKITWLSENHYRKIWCSFSKKALPIFSAILLSSSIANADCIMPTITSATSVAASCPGTGEIHIAATGGANIQYSIMSGATSIIGPISSGDFYSLSAGTYVVRAYNPEEGGCFKDTAITIANTYVPFSFTASVTSICAGTTAGTINVTTVPGSSTALQVAYWQGNANAPDPTLTYGTTFSHIVPETSFGVWNIRVKDACGEAITSQITVGNPYPAGLEFTYMAPWAPYTGIECIGTNPNIDAWVQLKANGIWISSINLPAEGVTITVFDNTDNDCLAEAGEQLTAFTDTISPSTNNDIRIPRNQRLLIRMTTPCGVVDEYCYDGLINGVPGGNIAFKQEDCPTVTNPDGTVSVQIFVNEFTTVPFTYTLVCSDTSFTTSGSNSTRTATVSGLPYGATYTVTVTDACGAPVYTQTATAMTATEPLTTNITGVSTENCTYETGKSTVRVQFNGHFPGLSASSTTVTITGGPNAGAVGVRSSDRSFYFYNLVPGTNTVTITNSACSTSAVLDFTVASGLSTLIQNVGISLDQLCGTVGIGNVTINSAYNGSGLPSVQLFKVGVATPVYSGSGGIVTVNNLDVGKYVAKLNVFWPINYACSPSTYDVVSDTVEIMPANSLPNITRKVSMICETPIGSPTEGKVSLEFNGSAPFRLEYKLSASSAWITHDTASTGIELLEGLTPNATYDLRITDKCGNIKTDNVTVGALGAVLTTNTNQPCINQPYTLSIPSFANATYSWKKNGVAITDTTRQINFQLFTDVNAGAYECTIVIGNCVIRTSNITLYSQFCDSTIPAVSLAGNIWNDGNGMTDNMVNGAGTNAGGAVFVVLTDMTGKVLATREVSATGAYSFDNLPPNTYKVLVTVPEVVGVKSVSVDPSGNTIHNLLLESVVAAT